MWKNSRMVVDLYSNGCKRSDSGLIKSIKILEGIDIEVLNFNARISSRQHGYQNN